MSYLTSYILYIITALTFYIGKFCVNSYNDDTPVVQVSGGGSLLGRRLDIVGFQVDAFLGIRYAEPPVGERRFRLPKPVHELWEGTRNATEFGSACWQCYYEIPAGFTGHPWWTTRDKLDEDCLFLNVWTPFPRPVDAPVFVFIHGGSFRAGATSTILYRGDTLAAVENCVVVSMNYRLGSLGFSAFYTENEPGNLGLLDQIVALKWVRKNIEHFGGDPRRVTLIGHSAGAASVGFHLVSPISRNEDLFHRAILQSGVPNTPWAMTYKDEALRTVGEMAKGLGCPSWYGRGKSGVEHEAIVEETLSCLRQRNPEEFFTQEEPIPTTVVVDGHFLSNDPISLLSTNPIGKNGPIPVLLGTVEEDATLNLPFYEFSSPEDIAGIQETYNQLYRYRIDMLFPFTDDTIRDAIDFQYRNWCDPDNGTLLYRGIIDIWEDYCMYCPVKEFAKYYAMAGNDVYAYRLNHRPSNSPYPEWMGMLHADDLFFTLGRALDLEEGLTDLEKTFSRSVMKYWSNFARTGNPNEPGESTNTDLPRWPKHTTTHPVYMTLTPKTLKHNTTVRRFERARECAFWSHLVPELANDKNIPVGLHPLFLGDKFTNVPEPPSKSPDAFCSGHVTRSLSLFTVIYHLTCSLYILHSINHH